MRIFDNDKAKGRGFMKDKFYESSELDSDNSVDVENKEIRGSRFEFSNDSDFKSEFVDRDSGYKNSNTILDKKSEESMYLSENIDFNNGSGKKNDFEYFSGFGGKDDRKDFESDQKRENFEFNNQKETKKTGKDNIKLNFEHKKSARDSNNSIFLKNTHSKLSSGSENHYTAGFEKPETILDIEAPVITRDLEIPDSFKKIQDLNQESTELPTKDNSLDSLDDVARTKLYERLGNPIPDSDNPSIKDDFLEIRTFSTIDMPGYRERSRYSNNFSLENNLPNSNIFYDTEEILNNIKRQDLYDVSPNSLNEDGQFSSSYDNKTRNKKNSCDLSRYGYNTKIDGRNNSYRDNKDFVSHQKNNKSLGYKDNGLFLVNSIKEDESIDGIENIKNNKKEFCLSKDRFNDKQIIHELNTPKSIYSSTIYSSNSMNKSNNPSFTSTDVNVSDFEESFSDKELEEYKSKYSDIPIFENRQKKQFNKSDDSFTNSKKNEISRNKNSDFNVLQDLKKDRAHKINDGCAVDDSPSDIYFRTYDPNSGINFINKNASIHRSSSFTEESRKFGNNSFVNNDLNRNGINNNNNLYRNGSFDNFSGLDANRQIKNSTNKFGRTDSRGLNIIGDFDHLLVSNPANSICFNDLTPLMKKKTDENYRMNNGLKRSFEPDRENNIIDSSSIDNGLRRSIQNKIQDSKYTCHITNEAKAYADYLATLLPPKINFDTEKPIFPQLSNGLVLGYLLNSMKKNLIDFNRIIIPEERDPNYSFETTDNLNYILKACKKLDINLVNIGSNDIKEQKPHLVLGLLWQLVRYNLTKNVNLKERPELMDLKLPDESLKEFDSLRHEDLCLRWINYLLGKARKGEFYLKLLEMCDENLRKSLSSDKNDEKYNNLSKYRSQNYDGGAKVYPLDKINDLKLSSNYEDLKTEDKKKSVSLKEKNKINDLKLSSNYENLKSEDKKKSVSLKEKIRLLNEKEKESCIDNKSRNNDYYKKWQNNYAKETNYDYKRAESNKNSCYTLERGTESRGRKSATIPSYYSNYLKPSERLESSHDIDEENYLSIPYQCRNFKKDISDSKVYLILLSQLNNGEFDEKEILDAWGEKNLLTRAEMTLNLADKMGCKAFVEAADIVKGDSRLNFLFSQNLMNKRDGFKESEDLMKPLKEKVMKYEEDIKSYESIIKDLKESLNAKDKIDQKKKLEEEILLKELHKKNRDVDMTIESIRNALRLFIYKLETHVENNTEIDLSEHKIEKPYGEDENNEENLLETKIEKLCIKNDQTDLLQNIDDEKFLESKRQETDIENNAESKIEPPHVEEIDSLNISEKEAKKSVVDDETTLVDNKEEVKIKTIKNTVKNLDWLEKDKETLWELMNCLISEIKILKNERDMAHKNLESKKEIDKIIDQKLLEYISIMKSKSKKKNSVFTFMGCK